MSTNFSAVEISAQIRIIGLVLVVGLVGLFFQIFVHRDQRDIVTNNGF